MDCFNTSDFPLEKKHAQLKYKWGKEKSSIGIRKQNIFLQKGIKI